MPEGSAAPHLRASDEDRERVVAALKEHCMAGRLSLDELPDRVAQAYAATTLRELAELTHDLPGRVRPGRDMAPTRPQAAADAGREAIRGNDRVRAAGRGGRDRGAAQARARSRQVRLRAVATDRRKLVFVRSGLLRSQRVQLTLDELGRNRTRLTIHGSASLTVRRVFAELRS